jgi:hypothetical protein
MYLSLATPIRNDTCHYEAQLDRARARAAQHVYHQCVLRMLHLLPCPTLQLVCAAGRRIASSLLLQQLLYFNVFWSIAWLVAFSSRIFWKVRQIRLPVQRCWQHPLDRYNMPTLVLQYGKGLKFKDPDVVRTVLSSFWLAAEPIRLWSGYYGNLQENVRTSSYYSGVGQRQRTAHEAAGDASTRCIMAPPGNLASWNPGTDTSLTLQVPWLVIFLILTMAPQVPVCFYLMMVQRVSAGAGRRPLAASHSCCLPVPVQKLAPNTRG